MWEGNLQELEEYDARMLDDGPVVRAALAAPQAGTQFRQTHGNSADRLDGPFLMSNAEEVASEILNGSVGLGGVNQPNDIRLVQRLLNSHSSAPQVPLSEDGMCGPHTIFAIKTYQKSVLRMHPPDGRVDPTGPTFRALSGAAQAPQSLAGSAIATLPPSAARTPSISAPPNMREAAWGYLLEFTKKHEGAVFHMYNNRPANSATQDVTCGVGFRLDPRGAVTQSWIKNMFFDPATNQTPSDDQLLADWDAAANLARTGTNLPQYATLCTMRMYPDRVYDRMALILRDQKLPGLLKSFPDDFKDFPNFPAAAQVFCVSFAYGRIPFDFPKMRTAIRDGRWADASTECHLQGCSELKNRAHADLLLLAQRVMDQNLNRDTLPPLASGEVTEFEAQKYSEAPNVANIRDGLADETDRNRRRADSLEFDPYTDIRAALRPEHASLAADELTVIVGRQPLLIALHRMLGSPEPQQAALATLLGHAGRRSMRLNGSDVPIPVYLRLLSRLCSEAAEQATAENAFGSPEPSGMASELSVSEFERASELRYEGEMEGSSLKWSGATQDQVTFMRAVYAQHVANAQARGTFIAAVPATDLSPIENGQRLRTETAGKLVSLLSDVRDALAAAQRTGDSSALQIRRVLVGSGYRSAVEQFGIWQKNFPMYYDRTTSDRSSLRGGAHGQDAISYLAGYVGRRAAAPGFSNHNDGRAVDLVGDLTGDRRLAIDSSDASIKLWRSSWLFLWLSNHGASYGFYQNTAINEPWHWEYRGIAASLPAQEVPAAVVSAGSTYVSGTPVLSMHHGTQPDLYVCWNSMPSIPSLVDVIVHLHGYSSHRDRMLLSEKVAASGLDFSEPSGSGVGRARASVGIIPRGNYASRSDNPDMYSFPALGGSTAMSDLIAYGLGRFANSIGASSNLLRRRLILTCHSGGGDSLGAILPHIDPDEIHLFDAVYGVPQALLAWIDRHVAADDSGISGTSALRMFYTLGKKTTPNANIIAMQVRNALQRAHNPRTLAPYFRVELTVGHDEIPRRYGWQLLADASARVQQTTQLLPAP